MADNVNLIVNNTIDNVNINPSIIDEIVDINVYDTATSIDINVTPNLTIVNVSQITGGEGGGGGTGNTNLLYVPSDIDGVIESDTGADATIPLADAVNAGLLSPSEKIKLETVTQGAEPNVNADWNATSGDAQILNKPAIPSISGLATVTYVDTQDALKVDKVPSYSLTKNDLTDALKSAYDSAVSWILTNGSNLISHLTNYSNPHQVTTTQIGAYTTTQVDTIANTKVDKNTAITAATKTKITYDTKGLVTNGVDATTADIADSSNKRYVTDANLTVIGNTSGTNTGDQNLQTVTNLGATTTTSITANSFIKQDGESYQFLKANGSVDSNVYLTSDDLPSTLDLYATTTASDISGYTVLVRTIGDPRYNTTAVDVSTGVITDIEQLVGSLITDANIISGNPGIFNFTTVGNIYRFSGSGQAEFFFRIYKRNLAGTETLIAESSKTLPVTNGGYVEFSAVALWNDGIFLETDRVVVKYYANRLASPVGSNPTYNFQFGGTSPVRSSAAIPTSVIPNIYLRDLADVENIDALNNEILYWNDTASLWEHSLAEDLVPLATATQKGLVSTTTQTFAGAKTFTGTIGASNLSGTNTGDNATNTQYSGLATSKQDKITLTVTGINGAATLTGATLNIPQYSGATDLQTTRTSTTFTIVSSTGADAEVPLGNGTLAGATSNDYTSAEKTKLSGIASGATVGVVPNGLIPAATNTKITYDAKGLVTGGTSLIAADIPTITQSQVTSLTTDLGLKAPLLSPSFTGTPVAITPPVSNNSTRLATTEYVDRQVNLGEPNNITIGNGTPTNYTTETLSTGGYGQYGKNVMVNNGANNITITVTLTTPADFIASYTKLGIGSIDFLAGSGVTLQGFPVASPTAFIAGASGSTALLTRTGNIFYLQVNNLS